MGAYPAGKPPPGTFVRSDANADSSVDISDVLTVLFYLFAGNVTPPCVDALDADDSGLIQVKDAIFILDFLFRNGPAPPLPYPEPGTDPTAGDPYTC